VKNVKKTRGVRVIAGSARGRRLVVPEGDQVRPTKDMVREAMFSALDARGALVDAFVLDLFAGSGALAIEAMSRGAERAVLVERDPRALDAIQANLDTLGFDEAAKVVAMDANRFVRAAPPADAPFDLVFIDPPYNATGDEEVVELLSALEAPGWLAADAIVTVERPVRRSASAPGNWQIGWERTFGDTLMLFYWR
jgi:16S rRNA (guanine966-N2)-methyltransferase